VWTDTQHVLFSEIKGTGLHMGIVTATASRSGQREIYFPEHERAMAHYSYLSPDRRWVLISEMDRTAAFQPCRLTPFDGSSPGRQVGPRGSCTATAWSPDGRWMYFSASVGGASHLWRQRFPDGEPERLTVGPGEEFGVSVAPDGRSLVTAVGQRRSSLWIRDTQGERQITTEGLASTPWLSPDGRRLYYLLRQNASESTSTELRSMDLATGQIDRLLFDRPVRQYAISADEREVAFVAETPPGVSEVWLAALDRSAPPRRVVDGADSVAFSGAALIVRSLEEKANFLMRVSKDGPERRRVLESPILNVGGPGLNRGHVSPDGKWAIVSVSGTGESGSLTNSVVSIEVGTIEPVCVGCQVTWGPDGKWLYATIVPDSRGPAPPGLLAIPLSATQRPPESLASLLAEAAAGKIPAGTRLIAGQTEIAPGPNPSVFAFTRSDMQRNLYRIPLH
jgi:Tol biopolymer transport system component